MNIISVIIPVYNVEDFLEVCIKSVVEQTYRNIEIILVDDGSTDRSGQICDKWAGIDERIIVIHKENGGLSDARNVGIEEAKGQYIIFVDSDDFIKRDLIRHCLQIVEEQNADIVVYDFQTVEENCNALISVESELSFEIMTGKELLREFLRVGKGHAMAWNKFYRREIWSDLRFPFGKIHEDEFVIADVFLLAEKVAISNQKLYFYRQRGGSIMSSRNIKAYYDLLEACRERCEKVHFDEELYGLALNRYFCCLIDTFWLEDDKEKRKLLRQRYKQAPEFSFLLAHVHWKPKIVYTAFYMSSYLYKILYVLINQKHLFQTVGRRRYGK